MTEKLLWSGGYKFSQAVRGPGLNSPLMQFIQNLIKIINSG